MIPVSQEHQHSHRVLAMKDAMFTDCATTKADPSASTLSGQGAAKNQL